MSNTDYYKDLIPSGTPDGEDPDATRDWPVGAPPGPQEQAQPESGQPAAPPRGEARNDMLAWAALIGGFIMWPLGILFGHVSNRAAKREHRRRSMLAIVGLVLSYLGMSIVSIVVIAGIAGSASSSPAVTTPPPASSAPASPVTPAAPITATSYLEGNGYTVVKSWSHDAWVKDSNASPVTPYLAKGPDVVAAGSKAGKVEIAFKLTDPTSAGASLVLQSLSSKDAGAMIDGSYLVTSFTMPTSGDAGSAAAGTNPAPASSAPATVEPAGPTVSQQQALGSAQSYLDMGTGFSRAGLIDQLSSKYGEKFSVSDATWAVDHCGADWNAQAVMSAKSYMQTSHFSRAGLIDQLTSPYGEKFTLAQATYAVNQVGL